MKIKAKLTLSYLGLVIFVSLLIAIPLVKMETNALTTNLTAIAEKDSDSIYSYMVTFFGRLENMLNSTIAFVSTGATDDVFEIEKFLAETKKTESSMQMLYYNTKEGSVQNGGIMYSDIHWLPPVDFDWSSRSWYTGAAATDKAILTEPYIDQATGELVITMAKRNLVDGVVEGVTGLDATITEITELIGGMKLSDSGESFLITKDGTYITNPDGSKIQTANFFDDYGFAYYKENLKYGNTIIDFYGTDKYVVLKEMPEVTGWYFASVGPSKEMFGTVYKTLYLIVGILALGILLAFGIGLIVTSTIVKPLNAVASSVKDIASGSADLSKRIDITSSDEMGDVATDFNSFAEKLQKIISDIKSSKDKLIEVGNEMSESTQETQSSITEIIANIGSVHSLINTQDSSVLQTSNVVGELTANIKNMENLVLTQTSQVEQASEEVAGMIKTITNVSESVDRMAKSFSLLQANAQKGSLKQKTVNERIMEIENQSQTLQNANAAISAIASQTNLLAMNAAIEAAHAGESGKGFSVVADEIRKLSETSSLQSKTIGEQLNQIRNSIASVVESSNEANAAFESVSREIVETQDVVEQIKSTMQLQSESSKNIEESLQNMNDSTVQVKEASAKMTEENSVILNEVHRLQDSTTNMKMSMDEMEAGAKNINETGINLRNMNENLNQSIDTINAQIDQFSV